MKRALVLLLLTLFTVTQSGLTIRLHWCSGKLASVSLFSFGSCCCGIGNDKPDCCKDKTVTLQAQEHLVKATVSTCKVPAPKTIADVFVYQLYAPVAAIQFGAIAAEYSHPPPIIPKTAIYILDGVFRI